MSGRKQVGPKLRRGVAKKLPEACRKRLDSAKRELVAWLIEKGGFLDRLRDVVSPFLEVFGPNGPAHTVVCLSDLEALIECRHHALGRFMKGGGDLPQGKWRSRYFRFGSELIFLARTFGEVGLEAKSPAVKLVLEEQGRKAGELINKIQYFWWTTLNPPLGTRLVPEDLYPKLTISATFGDPSPARQIPGEAVRHITRQMESEAQKDPTFNDMVMDLTKRGEFLLGARGLNDIYVSTLLSAAARVAFRKEQVTDLLYPMELPVPSRDPRLVELEDAYFVGRDFGPIWTFATDKDGDFAVPPSIYTL